MNFKFNFSRKCTFLQEKEEVAMLIEKRMTSLIIKLTDFSGQKNVVARFYFLKLRHLCLTELSGAVFGGLVDDGEAEEISLWEALEQKPDYIWVDDKEEGRYQFLAMVGVIRKTAEIELIFRFKGQLIIVKESTKKSPKRLSGSASKS